MERRITVRTWDGREYEVDGQGRIVSEVRRVRAGGVSCAVCGKELQRCDCEWERRALTLAR